ncbi:MAG: GNAT family acetyltransferase [Sphingomonadales bacterium BRH_c42]|nr:MAG: GNAT family acetyltransferase [Sphingomonadales bacterium BRH_c42]
MFHRSQNLLLRPAWPEDWQSVHAGIADHGVVRNLARAPWPYRQSDARSYVESTREPMFPRFLITRVGDAALVGCIGIDRKGPDIELGYWIARQHWGRGYATEAGRAVLEISTMLGHRRLVASHFLDNPASGRVLQKLGFEATGRVVSRYSCGRGEDALAAEYALELDQTLPDMMRAA